MVSSSGTNVFLIPTVHYTTCSVADLFWPGRPRAPKCSHVTGSPQMQLEIPITPNHPGHSAVPKARAPAGTAPGLLDRLCQVWYLLDNSQPLMPNGANFTAGTCLLEENGSNSCFFSRLSCFQELWSCGPGGLGGLGGGLGAAGALQQHGEFAAAWQCRGRL